MGWCSATEVFDPVVGFIIDHIKTVNDRKRAKEVITKLVEVLEDNDWDCQTDSDHWNQPLVQEVFRELHPEWFDDDEE